MRLPLHKMQKERQYDQKLLSIQIPADPSHSFEEVLAPLENYYFDKDSKKAGYATFRTSKQ